LLIADIGGYTKFMKLHRLSLAHSQDITGRLLNAIIKAAPGLELVEVEGDAAFFYAPGAGTGAASKTATERALAMHRAFHAQQEYMIACNMCSCDGCTQAGKLKVKFVAHIGEALAQRVGRKRQLVGLDVILVHRMLKNSVPIPEYLLMSEPLFEEAGDTLGGSANAVDEDWEGLGRTRAYFVDMEEIGERIPTPARNPSILRRVGATLGVMFRGMPYLIGIRQRRSAS